MKKRIICAVLVFALIFSMSTQALAVKNDQMLSLETTNDDAILQYLDANGLNEYNIGVEPTITIPNRIFDNEEEVGKLPGITTRIYIEPTPEITPKTYGEGYVIGRARAWKTASDGYIRKGYKKGTFSSIASTALSFIPGVATMTVSAILSVVGLIASNVDMVSGETLISYRYLYRDGEGRWSTDPNTSAYWYLGHRTGRRETYKHVIGGKLDQSTQLWNFQVKNYPSPIDTEDSLNYNKSDSWLAEQGRQRVAIGDVYVETPW